MSNSKISLPELADLLARKSDGTKKEAETFLKEFFSLATEVLSAGETLKINGLGVFKPVWVEKRSSVNVQTGQPCEIPGHYKLSFVPDKSMRDAVNAPFSCFEAEMLPDDVVLDDTETVTLPDVPDDTVSEETETDLPSGPADVPEESGEPEPVVVPPVPETVRALDKDSSDETVVAEVAGEPTDSAEKPAADTPLAPDSDDDNRPEERRKKQTGFWYGFLTAALLFLVIDVAWLLYGHGFLQNGKERLPRWFPGLVQPRAAAEDTPEDSLSTVVPLPVDSIALPAADNGDSLSQATSPVEPSSVPNPEPEVVTDVLRDGVFLTTLSLRHYGHKAFWVYIYQENQDKIAHPDRVPTGTRVVIPDKSKYGIDAGSERSIQKAKDLAEQILSK